MMKTNDLHPFFGIWCGKANWTNYISDEFYHMWKDLEDVHGWKEVANLPSQNRRWLINDTLSSYFIRYFTRMPDLILYVETYETIKLHSELPDWRLIPHTWLFMDDVHSFTSDASKLKKSALMAVENIIATYPYKIDEQYSMETHTEPSQWFTLYRTWIPHSASISFFVGYNRNPVMKIFLSGAINNIYPYRQMALKMYEENPSDSLNNMIKYHKHPGYRPVVNATLSNVRNGYAQLINRYFAAMTDTSSKNYIVGKIFEIPAAGALLLVNSEAISI
jgi:hypothetical protein